MYLILDDKGIIYTGNEQEMSAIFYAEEKDFEREGDLVLAHIIDRTR